MAFTLGGDMNERINELAIKAGGIWRGGYVEQANGDSVWTDRKFVVDVDTEQFARLIVKECADFVTERATIETLLGKLLKEHFGVEE
jgi:hypothetical protein